MKVSVHIITYNHEKYLAQALDSVLMQEVNFDYEIVIGEDCSTDKTRQIVIDYQQKYPEKIRALLHEKNLGVIENEILVHNACKGEYIAWLEGDDYWTSPHKLQKQVDFLDEHPECSMCFHSTRHFYEDKSKEDYDSKPPTPKNFFTSEDLFVGNFMPTCSIMFRRQFLPKFPDWYHQVYGGDTVVQVLCAQHGNIGYIDEVMAVTRIHKGGVWNGISKIKRLKHVIDDYTIMRANLSVMNNSVISHLISRCYFDWAVESAHEGNLDEARKTIIHSFIEAPLHPYISNMERIKLLIKVYIPGLNTLVNHLRS